MTTALTLHRSVGVDQQPPFIPGQPVMLTYRVTAGEQAARIDRVEQVLVRGWQPHPSAKERWNYESGALSQQPGQVVEPGGSLDITVPVMLLSFDGYVEPLPCLAVEASTHDGGRPSPAMLQPLAAPKVGKANLKAKVELTNELTGEVSVANAGDVPIEQVAIQLAGASAMYGAEDLGQGRTTVGPLAVGKVVSFTVSVDEPEQFGATVVEARLPNGVRLPPAMLPAQQYAQQGGMPSATGVPVGTVVSAPTIPDASAPHQRRGDESAGGPDDVGGRDELQATRSNRTSEVDGVGIVETTVMDQPRELTVGGRATVGPTVVNATGQPAHNIKLVAWLPPESVVSVKDDSWQPYRPGAVMRFVPFVPANSEVQVPLTVRMNRTGDATIEFEIPTDDDSDDEETDD